MSAVLYAGEAAGNRIFRYGSTGYTRPGGAYNARIETYDAMPGGEAGTCIFSLVVVAMKSTQGYAIGVTPVVDGVSLPEQLFTASVGGFAVVRCYIPFNHRRGTRISAVIRTTSILGDVEFDNVKVGTVVIRRLP